MARKIVFILRIITSPLFQLKLLPRHRRSEQGETAEGKQRYLERGKNTAANMLSAVSWNADFVEETCQGADGTAALNIERLFGSVLRLRNPGKRFCPDSKAIPEQVIEEAFIESYKMLSMDNKDVLEEFLHRTEKALGESSIEEQLNKLKRSIERIKLKRKKLLDNYLNDTIENDVYKEMDTRLKTDLTNAVAKLEFLQEKSDQEDSLQRRIAEFKKALSNNNVLKEFDRGIFESIIEKVIVGGYDEDGNKDPYKITFIYKTGFKNEIGSAKERFDKSKNVKDKQKNVHSHIMDKVKDVCSQIIDDTCGDCVPLGQTKT